MSLPTDPEAAARREAAEWVAKLSGALVSNDDIRAFRSWRAEPANTVAWEALETGGERRDRYVVRPQTERFRVVDIWTGETAVIAMTPQDAMSEQDALHMARLLNRRAAGGDHAVLL